MNKFFAVACALVAVAAFYGAVFMNKEWHFLTFFMAAFFSLLLFADSGKPKKHGLSGN